MKNALKIVAPALAVALGLGGIAYAHHAVNAAFIPDKFVTVQGTLFKVAMINPHSQFFVYITSPAGKKDLWQIESSSVNGMKRAGLSQRGVLVPGETLSIVINPSRDGSNRGFLREITFANGRKVNMAASVIEPGQ